MSENNSKHIHEEHIILLDNSYSLLIRNFKISAAEVGNIKFKQLIGQSTSEAIG